MAKFTIKDALAAFPMLVELPRDWPARANWLGVKPGMAFHDYPLVSRIQIFVNGWLQFITDAGNSGGQIDKVTKKPVTKESKVLRAIERRDALESGTHSSRGSGGKLSNRVTVLRQFIAAMLDRKYPKGYERAEIIKAITADPEKAYLAGCVVQCGGDTVAAGLVFAGEYAAVESKAIAKAKRLDEIDAESGFNPDDFTAAVAAPVKRAA